MKFFVTFFQGGGWCRSSTGPVVWQLGERPQAQGQTLETICHWESSHRSVSEWECIRRPRLYTFNYLCSPWTSNSGCQSWRIEGMAHWPGSPSLSYYASSNLNLWGVGRACSFHWWEIVASSKLAKLSEFHRPHCQAKTATHCDGLIRGSLPNWSKLWNSPRS